MIRVGLATLLLVVTSCNAAPSPNRMICEGDRAPSGEEARASRLKALTRPRTPSQTLAIERQYAEACLRRWSYRLASADLAAGDLQTAVTTRCEREIEDWRTAGRLVEPPPSPSDLAAEADRRTLLFIAQARAGGCAVAGD